MYILKLTFLFQFFLLNCLAFEPANLRIDNQVTPIGFDNPPPEFSWVLTSAERGTAQSGYEIGMPDSEKNLEAGKSLVWATGKVTGRTSTLNQLFRNYNY